MFRNLGRRFSEVCENADANDKGYSMGLTSGDWNQDGFQDLLIGNLFANSLLINQGDGTFREHATEDDWKKGMFTTGVAIADINGDSLPDVVEINYVDDVRIFDSIKYGSEGKPLRLPGPTQFKAGIDRVFLSVGDGTMRQQPLTETPEDPLPRAALGLVVGNLDGQDGNDIFVANDQTANHFWKATPLATRGEIGFVDLAPILGLSLGVRGLPLASMGIAVADFDGNGRPDLHVTSFNDELSNHFLQQDHGSFDDRVVSAGLAELSRHYVGFGTQAVDSDNNTEWDLWVGNGHVDDFRDTGQEFQMPIQLLVSELDQFRSAKLPADEAFFREKHLSRPLAKLDWNRDGLVDVLVGDLLGPLALLENQTRTPHHWLGIQLVGTDCERDAIGARIEIQLGNQTFHHFVCTGDGYMCRNQNVMFAGLGMHGQVDRLTVHWPNATQQTWSNLNTDQCIIITQDSDEVFSFGP